MPEMPLPVSYSKLSDYEKCPALAMYRYIERIETPKGPALTRGIGVHADGEKWMKAGPRAKLPGLYEPFREELEPLKKAKAQAEPTFYVDSAWGPCYTREAAFLVAKLDVLHVAGPHARVIDYKTGKPYDSHKDQGVVYTLATWAHHPEVQTITAEFWYLDAQEIRDATYRQSNIKGLRRVMTQRLMRMVDDREFQAKPGTVCRWCDYHSKKGGPCKSGI